MKLLMEAYIVLKHIHGAAETGLWLRFYYSGKRVNDFTILRKRVNDFTIWAGRGNETTDGGIHCNSMNRDNIALDQNLKNW